MNFGLGDADLSFNSTRQSIQIGLKKDP